MSPAPGAPRVVFSMLATLLAGTIAAFSAEATPPAAVTWRHLSSAQGDLPVPPGGSIMQTGAVVHDFDGDGTNDFVLSFRQKAPALVWYRRGGTGWVTFVIEPAYLTVEAGGAVADIDGDGDPDLVFGGDWQSNEVWWWENPAPHFGHAVPWTRHGIKRGGKTQHHDQAFGDFLGTGRPQLAYWNQQARGLFLAPIPTQPRGVDAWPAFEIFAGSAGGSTPYTEGMSTADIDADGRLDLLAYRYWFKPTGGTNFHATPIGEVGGLIVAGRFKPSKYPQVVISPGDGNGPLRWYECTGHPDQPADWVGHDLLDRPIVHGHSLQVGDINGDGHLDLFAAEMAQWHEQQPQPDHPDATAWIFYGDGQGHFARTELVKGEGWHEARLADLDGDGRLDLLNKPYTWKTPRVDVWLNQGVNRLPATTRPR